MKILFLTDNFPPEVNAPATRTFEHCKRWVQTGTQVTVITCAPNFPNGRLFKGYKNKIYQKELIDGIEVIRVWSYMVANKGFLKRTLDYLSFAISAFIAGLGQKPDIIIATSPQFFTAIAGRKLSFWTGIPWIMEVRDLWPDSIKNVGAINNNFLFRLLEKKEINCYKKSKAIVVAVDFTEEIKAKGIDIEKIKIIKNGANLELFSPGEKPIDLIEKHHLENKFIIGYLGTHGMAHKLDFILFSARKILDPDIHFLFIGDGAEKEYLIDLSEKLELKNVTFLDTVDKQTAVRYLNLIDVALISLKKSDLFKNALPSKIFESAAMQKPILLGVDGEARKLIGAYNAGIYFEPENETDFIRALEKIKADKRTYNLLKDGGKYLAKDFERNKLADQMLEFIKAQIN